MTMQSRRIAVLGAGTMGAGIAAVYAIAGYPVALYSRTEGPEHDPGHCRAVPGGRHV